MGIRTPKEIGRLAGRVFKSSLPGRWVVRSQEDQEDYGVDYEIELISKDDQATGFLFKVQQKGVEVASPLANGEAIPFSLETAKVRYYLKLLRVPIILVIVDLASEGVYWLRLQGDRDVERRFEEAQQRDSKSLTLHVPTRNSLPGTESELLDAVNGTFNYLAITGVRQMPTIEVQRAINDDSNLVQLARSLAMTQMMVRSARTQQHIDQGQLLAAYQLNKKAFANTEELIEGRFTAAMQVVRIAGGLMATDTGDINHEELLRLRFTVYHKLVKLTRQARDPLDLQHYSIFLARCARLRILVDRDLGVFMSREVQKAEPDDLARIVSESAQQRSSVLVTNELRRAQSRLLKLSALGSWGIVIYAWSELSEAISFFLFRLGQDGRDEEAKAIRDWLDEFGELCLDVAKLSKESSLLRLCIINHVRIGTGTEGVSQRVERSRLQLVNIDVATERREAEASLNSFAAMTTGTPTTGVPSERDLAEMVRQMAQGLGIDIDDEQSEIADVIRIGIRDFNPERVLRDCEHLQITLGPSGQVARVLGLPTAGMKSVHCIKHGARIQALSLDRAYNQMKRSFCEGCSDRSSRPQAWSWSPEWQKEEEERISLGGLDEQMEVLITTLSAKRSQPPQDRSKAGDHRKAKRKAQKNSRRAGRKKK